MPELHQIFTGIKPKLIVKFNKSEIPHHQIEAAITLIKDTLVKQLNEDLAADKLDNIILLFMGSEHNSHAYLHLIYDYTEALVKTLGVDREKASSWSHHIIPYSITLIGNHLSYSDFTKIGVINLINSSENNSSTFKESLSSMIKSFFK